MSDAAIRAGAQKIGLPFRPRTAVAVGAALAVAIGGVAWIVAPKGAETTDAAYVQADRSVVAPKVRGLVSQVLVEHNQPVRRGQPLVRIDPEEFDARVTSAEAELVNAEAGVAQVKAAIISLDAEERLAGAQVVAARTLIRSADAQDAKAAADAKRYADLVASGAVAKHDVDQYRAAAVSAQSEAERSRAELDVNVNQAAVVRAKRATLQANLAAAEAAVARTRAALDLARQDQSHAVIYAPIDGVVGDRQVEPGDYVQPGTRLLDLVPMNALYVTANFKETQTGRMAPGQPAEIRVDSLPGSAFKGHIDSLAPGSGSTFSLLPFEPGTGNFTKIVQRIPVRIRFDPNQPALARLRPGLSTVVTVKLATPSGGA